VLLERERELSELAEAAREAAAGDGGLVLVSGEAGIGKSSLVRAVRGLLPPRGGGGLLVGHCDDLGTPQTLGPFRDLGGQVGAELTRALREAATGTWCRPRRGRSWLGRAPDRPGRRGRALADEAPWTCCGTRPAGDEGGIGASRLTPDQVQ
jgi:energy-coupling factor transporter ATP-binding protein EcfA2